jgi:hypothetical protein
MVMVMVMVMVRARLDLIFPPWLQRLLHDFAAPHQPAARDPGVRIGQAAVVSISVSNVGGGEAVGIDEQHDQLAVGSQVRRYVCLGEAEHERALWMQLTTQRLLLDPKERLSERHRALTEQVVVLGTGLVKNLHVQARRRGVVRVEVEALVKAWVERLAHHRRLATVLADGEGEVRVSDPVRVVLLEPVHRRNVHRHHARSGHSTPFSVFFGERVVLARERVQAGLSSSEEGESRTAMLHVFFWNCSR